MSNLRKYGHSPFKIAVIHGGPGGAGEIAPVARELSSKYGVLEPLQTTSSVYAQVRELRAVLTKEAKLPVVLIGYSWGAWLSIILAAKHPALVKKLILIGSGPFKQRYAAGISKLRLDRMKKEKVPDAYDPIPGKQEPVNFQSAIFNSVWPEAEKLRKSGKLLKLAKNIKCPVVAIHGDYDPHPAEGVQKPLSTVLKDFRFILLKHCGHKPLIEKAAREKFFSILSKELQ
jgi:pimeloyl-ACP methyl ester carboxylesterase